MTERETALCDLAYAHGMKAATIMLAQGADEMVRQIIERLHSDALCTLRRERVARIGRPHPSSLSGEKAHDE